MKYFHSIRRLFVGLLVGSLPFFPASALPIYDANEYAELLATAGKRQYVQVTASLANAFIQPNWNDPAFQSELAAKTNALLVELGDTVVQNCVRRDSPGILYLYATPEGLRRLAASERVRNLSRSYGRNAIVYDPAQWFDEIENVIERSGYADIQVALNLENFVFEYGPYGQASYPVSGDLIAELKQKLPDFAASLPPQGIFDSEALKARLTSGEASSPIVEMRIAKEGLYCLQINPLVRGMRLTYPAPAAAQFFAADVLEEARQTGHAIVNISLYPPLGYSLMGSRLPAKAVQAQDAASKRAWNEIISAWNGNIALSQSVWGTLGSFRLTLAEVGSLYRVADPRIQRVSKAQIITIDDPSPPLKQQGPLTARTIAMDLTPISADIGKIGGVYVAALVHDAGNAAKLYFLDSAGGWMPFTSCANASAHYFGELKALTDIPLVATPTDLSKLVGTDIYAGWGVGISAANACQNMLNNGTYLPAKNGITP